MILSTLICLCLSEKDFIENEHEKIQYGVKHSKYCELKLQHLLNYHSDDKNEILFFIIQLAELNIYIYQYDHALLNYERALVIYYSHQNFLHETVTKIYKQMAIIYFQ